MVGTFLYLTACSVRNRIRARLTRLRQPRYAIGLLVGIAYFYFFVFGRGFRPRSRRRYPDGRDNPPQFQGPQSPMTALLRLAPTVQFAGGLALFLFAAVAWIWPGAQRPIEFSRPEVQFLFTAPLTRRQLLHYKLLRSQLGLLFGSAIATIFLRPGSFFSGWTFFVGVWLLLSIVRLYGIGVAFSRQSLARHGRSGLARQWLPLAALLGAMAGLAWPLIHAWPALAQAGATRAGLDIARDMWSSGVARYILWPFAALAALPLSASSVQFLQHLPAVLAILGLCYGWVLRADAAFEEAAADQAEQRAKTPGHLQPRVPKVRSKTPFELAPTGRPETAILWKNLILIGRYASARMLVRFVPLVFLLAIALSRGSNAGALMPAIAFGALMIGVGTVLIGPTMARNDLRQDLASLAVLKSWPMRGAALIRGEILAPLTVLTVIAWSCLLVSAALSVGAPVGPAARTPSFAGHWSFAVAALLLTPAFIGSQLVVHNGAAVLFPAWVTVGSSRARGVEAMGQRLLMMAGIMLMLVVSVLPAAIVAALVAGAIYFSTGVIPIIVPAAIVAGVMMAECLLAVEWLGKALERTDVTAVEASE